ncbi:MAG: CoA transferase subunit A [Bacteroidales bacterium]|jgi:acetate CoA/acetoacetate CoA-transferase alpha subunit|nr:CoA transferase subunit A [Bacteroidales bacterium]
MIQKVISASEACKKIKSGMTLFVGGFLKCGSPTDVINEILKTDINNLTLVGNDTSYPDADRGLLVSAHKVKKVIATHIGLNKETGRQMLAGEIEVELVPQGTLCERIRAAGVGLGGVLTPTGIGTEVAKGKEVLHIDGKEYLLEKPLHADVALIYGSRVDKAGNIAFVGTTRNTNVVMATAADTVIVEAEEYIDGYLNPNEVVIPSVFVDYIVIQQPK